MLQITIDKLNLGQIRQRFQRLANGSYRCNKITREFYYYTHQHIKKRRTGLNLRSLFCKLSLEKLLYFHKYSKQWETKLFTHKCLYFEQFAFQCQFQVIFKSYALEIIDNSAKYIQLKNNPRFYSDVKIGPQVCRQNGNQCTSAYSVLYC